MTLAKANELPHSDIDPDGLLEFSVVFTDRSLNHMSKRFIGVMQELTSILRETYNAQTVAIVPGGGSYGMESIARQFGTGKKCLVVRNGLFSYRWTQIFEAGSFTASHDAICAIPAGEDSFAPAASGDVVEKIKNEKPDVVFAPHVETASGIVLSNEYIREIAAATHEVGGLFVLDCVASGPLWVDMKELDIDVLLSAPQKGWSGTPCAGYVMLGERARAAIEDTQSSSFALDLRKWLGIAEGYVEGNHGYYATMPTDSLAHNLETMKEATGIGLDKLKEAQCELGRRVRSLFDEFGFTSVAAQGWQSPTVVVVNTPAESVPDRFNSLAEAFAEAGLQIAAGVPLHIGEPEGYSAIRIGLFGLDKWMDIDGTVANLRGALEKISDAAASRP